MAILGIESAVFGVEDLELCTRFWDDFGLVPAAGPHEPRRNGRVNRNSHKRKFNNPNTLRASSGRNSAVSGMVPKIFPLITSVEPSRSRLLTVIISLPSAP